MSGVRAIALARPDDARLAFGCLDGVAEDCFLGLAGFGGGGSLCIGLAFDDGHGAGGEADRG